MMMKYFEQEVTDWELCYSDQYATDMSVWTLDRSFDDCRGPIEWDIDKLRMDWEDIARCSNGQTYTANNQGRIY